MFTRSTSPVLLPLLPVAQQQQAGNGKNLPEERRGTGMGLVHSMPLAGSVLRESKLPSMTHLSPI